MIIDQTILVSISKSFFFITKVEPKVFFGSGPTKKDAKFACGTIAWAAIQNPSAVKSQLGADGSLPTADPSQPGGKDRYLDS